MSRGMTLPLHTRYALAMKRDGDSYTRIGEGIPITEWIVQTLDLAASAQLKEAA